MTEPAKEYDAADDGARCYDEAIKALREKIERGEPVVLFGRKVELAPNNGETQ